MLFLPWKMMFSYVIFLGTCIAISASSWMMAWMGLEINMLGLLALLMSFKSSRNSEATLKYFLIQALASAILICSAFSGSMLFGHLSSLDFFSSFILLSLLIKLGAAPFHLWVPQIIEGFHWINSSLILTWQKVAPFFLLLFCIEGPTLINYKIMWFSIIMSALIGAVGGLSQTSSRKIIAFSSINHMGWLMISLIYSTALWAIYFLSYSMILISLILLMWSFNISSLSQTSVSLNKLTQSALFISLFSFGGLPPFSGFIPKWLVINSLTDSPIIITIMVISSLITLFFYLRIAMSSLLQKIPVMNLSLCKHEQGKFISASFTINFVGIILTPFLFLL